MPHFVLARCFASFASRLRVPKRHFSVDLGFLDAWPHKPNAFKMVAERFFMSCAVSAPVCWERVCHPTVPQQGPCLSAAVVGASCAFAGARFLLVVFIF